MIIVLLCQGLIFQSGNPEDPALLFFGALTVVILAGAALGSVFLVLRRALKQGGGELLVSKTAFDLLSDEAKSEICQLYSSTISMKDGQLEFDVHELRSHLNPLEFQEITNSDAQAQTLEGTKHQALSKSPHF
eukprot:TRINITY_DN11027_c0_g2_i1.p1 TRINITY_DN11027_c0_g2~~TRINITY_DN11027_c0_g2_i1.p1  ORF type:complete len:133 (-),score=22.51 TRINITY_DN11027_c0_g2_i1:21-419(-)